MEKLITKSKLIDKVRKNTGTFVDFYTIEEVLDKYNIQPKGSGINNSNIPYYLYSQEQVEEVATLVMEQKIEKRELISQRELEKTYNLDKDSIRDIYLRLNINNIVYKHTSYFKPRDVKKIDKYLNTTYRGEKYKGRKYNDIEKQLEIEVREVADSDEIISKIEKLIKENAELKEKNKELEQKLRALQDNSLISKVKGLLNVL